MLLSLSWLRTWCCLSVLVMPLGLVNDSLAEDAPDDLQWSIIAPLAPQTLLLDGTLIDDLMVVVGERGHVLLSEDMGNTWEQVRVPTRATLTGVFFSDRENGWAVGHDAVIIKTSDGGATWTRVHFAPDEERPLLDVWFEDSSHGIVIGAYGYFLETFDGGETWEDRFFEVVGDDEAADETDEEEKEVSIADMMDFLDDEDPISDLHLNDIRSAPDGALFLAAEAGHIFRSDDVGETWKELPSPYEGSFYGTLPLGENSLLVYGLRGNLFYSADGGQSWQQIDVNTDAIFMGGAIVDGSPAVVGLGGTLLVAESTSGGPPVFSLLQQENRKALATLMPGNSGELILIGENGVNTIVPGQSASSGDAP
ncbi:MAG: hypothetical protein HKN59_00810 [Gammaproteobacteria bacterium]|nr:hypothetical protein [Gammaproteobacteria bacterium]